MKEETVEADVLCVGGGISGFMAAIRASELGAKVVVAEKGNTLRSGSGGAGNNHFGAYLPEVHGDDIEAFIRLKQKQHSKRSAAYVRTLVEKSTEIVRLWESWGIPFKYKGEYDCGGHGMPGTPNISLRYNGMNQKPILTEQALKRGVKIVNRSMVFDLISDDSIKGAVAIDTREDKLTEFHAKSVILGAGRTMRLYPTPTPAWMFNLDFPPSLTRVKPRSTCSRSKPASLAILKLLCPKRNHLSSLFHSDLVSLKGNLLGRHS